MLDNEIMNIEAHRLIEIVLCINKAVTTNTEQT